MSRTTALIAPAAAAALLALLAPAAQAAGRIDLSYVKPEQFSDAGRFSSDRERTLKSLSEYFAKLGQRLPDGQTLKVEVLDIDLAGEIRPSRSGQDIRVLRGGADWPRITLRYALQGAAGTLKSGQADLADMSYQDFVHGQSLNYGDLPYEKHMVERWFDQTIIGR
jgi:hypothetical protein